jgi:hypothetical protein
MPYNINQATTGALTAVASENISAVEYPQIKIGWGVAGSFNLVSLSNPLPVQSVAATSGGLTPYHLKALASTNLTSLKASAGQLYNGSLFNASGSVKYFKLYDKASAPVPASDTPVQVYPLEAGKTTPIDFGASGLQFTNGIAFSITGALANTDTTALAANDVIVNLGYK